MALDNSKYQFEISVIETATAAAHLKRIESLEVRWLQQRARQACLRGSQPVNFPQRPNVELKAAPTVFERLRAVLNR